MNEFKKYHATALGMYEQNKRMRAASDISVLERKTLNWDFIKREILFSSMIVDLATTPFYKAVAKWMDPVNGLSKDHPKEMKEVAELFL